MTEKTQWRVPKLPREEWTDASREVCAFWGEPNAWEEGSKTNIIMVMANHPDLGKVYNIWGKHFLINCSLPVREYEIIILRVAWHTKSEYEWHNHVGYALNLGMSLDEIAAIKTGPDAPNWDELDSNTIRAVDELMQTGDLTDATWAALSKHFDRKQMMDFIFTVGHYVMTSWAITAMRMPLEPYADQIGWDLKTASGKTPGKTYKPGETEDWADKRGYDNSAA
jgi:4-carboxymuconolactone decarboxylase